MKTVVILLALAITAIASAADQKQVPRREYRFGLGDPKFGICALAANFFTEHKAWPVTRAELEAYFTRVAERENLPRDEAIPEEFFRQFAELDLSRKDAALILRLRVAQEESSTVIVLKPGSDVDGILEAATGEESNLGKQRDS